MRHVSPSARSVRIEHIWVKASQRHMSVCPTANDNMIIKGDSDYFPCLDQLSCSLHIFVARCCVSTWMGMDDYYGCSPKPNSIAENISRMERSSIKDTSEHKHRFAKHPALCVKIDCEGVFLLVVNACG